MSAWRDLTALLPGGCVACPSRNDCGGGYRAEALHERGRYAALDTYAVPELAAASDACEAGCDCGAVSCKCDSCDSCQCDA